MIPERFSVDVSMRMLMLLDACEPVARERDLTTSFALMAAMPLLIIPFERTNVDERGRAKSDLNDVVRDTPFFTEFSALLRRPFHSTFVAGPGRPDSWRFLELATTDIDHISAWRDSLGRHPFAPGAINEIKSQPVHVVLATLRHALAHANVVYLSEEGREEPGRRATHLAFVSRARRFSRGGAPTYRVVVVEETAFVDFLRTWAEWLRGVGMSTSLRVAA